MKKSVRRYTWEIAYAIVALAALVLASGAPGTYGGG